MSKKTMVVRPQAPRTCLGQVLAGQFARAAAALRHARNIGRLEEVARQLGADLCDAEQFRVVQELADAA